VKKRPEKFLAELFQEPQPMPGVADYIQELHEYLWRFVRAEFPWASGSLEDYVSNAAQSAEFRAKRRPHE
jgi:hypothetical protein